MNIVNVMLGKGLGGIEYVSVLFAKALAMRGHNVLMVIRHGAAIEKALLDAIEEYPNIQYKKIRVWGDYDLLAKKRARQILRAFNADAVIARGNRAVRIFKKAAQGLVPLIAGTPNYRFRSLLGLQGILATTDDLKNAIVKAGQPAGRIWVLPNTLEVNAFNASERESFQSPVVIGTMGRFVRKKGFHKFIEAMHLLNKQDIDFNAVIGGSGEEQDDLEELVKKFNLEGKVRFTGWVDDKQSFFDKLDIFVLPSLHEPFGIILLEAFAARLPVITSDSEGPVEIGEHEKDCLIYPKEDVTALFEAIKTMLSDEQESLRLADNGLEKVKSEYDLPVFASRLDEILTKVTSAYEKAAGH